MIMRLLRSWLIPDEWQSAAASLADLLGDVKKTSHAWLKHIIGYVIVWSAGAYTGHMFWVIASAANVSSLASTLDGVVRAILTMSGIMAGFMITLMLFTGKTEAWKALTYEQAAAFVEKATYLIFSQFITLANHMAVVVSTVAWFVVAASGNVANSHWLVIVMFGFLLVSILRTVLVPMQIAELHRFALGAMLADKEAELNQKVADRFK